MPALSVIEGRPDAPVRIALSLVHPRERIDIPVRDVIKIEACAEQMFFFSDTLTSKTYEYPHVLLTFKPNIGARIFRLTSLIVDQPLDIVVAGEVVCSPVVREPYGIREKLCVSAFDMEQAERLAAKIRKGWVIPDLRVVG